MVDFLHIAQHIDVAPLRAALARQPELFGQHPQRTTSPNSPHREVSDIWVRFNAPQNIGPHFSDAHDSVWYPAWYALPELHGLVFDLMRHVQGERLGGILITKLTPGGKVSPHIDKGWHAAYYEKFYIAIQNPLGAVFQFPGQDLIAKDGDCFWFTNAVLHGVINESSQERIALIVCIKTDLFKGESRA